MRIGIIAAMPGELKPLVRGWAKMPVARGSGIVMWQIERGDDELVAVCAGMGAAAARRGFTAAEFAGSLDVALSVGWAGALSAGVTPGESYMVSQIVDALTGERFGTGSPNGLRLVTTAHVADEAEKHRLGESYQAGLVDMEAAAVARLAQMRGLPFHCVKSVSDGMEARLPNLNPFIDIDGKLRMTAFLAHVTVRPQYWGPLLQLGRNSAGGAVAMAAMIEKFLAEEVQQ
jgi:adenosylhomocysteine nucleosidase